MKRRASVPAPHRQEARTSDLQRVDELLRLQRNAPAPAIADEVLRHLHRRQRSWLERLLPRPRRRWLRPLALSLSAACALALVGGSLGYGAGLILSATATSESESESESEQNRTPTSPLSMQRIVRLALTAPGATSVGVVGDFNGWSSDRAVQMTRIGDDRFMATLELAPGRYAYAFVVDGAQVRSDPHALAWEDDGFGGRNSVVEL